MIIIPKNKINLFSQMISWYKQLIYHLNLDTIETQWGHIQLIPELNEYLINEKIFQNFFFIE